MTRKFAIGIAASLVAALMAGVVALRVGRGVVGATSTSASTPAPIVKTETKVITVKRHRHPTGAGQETITVVRPAPAAVSGSSIRSDDSRDHEDGFGDDTSEESGGDD